MENTKRKNIIVFTIVAILVFLGVVISFFVGKYSLSIVQVLKCFIGKAERVDLLVFWNLRFPRTLMCLVGGFAFGLSGYIFQSIFKNPLASPDIIGVSSGANLGAAISIILGGVVGSFAISIGAFVGAFLSVILVISLVNITKSHSTTSYVLVGIIINAFSRAVIMLIKYFADPASKLAAIEYWEMGTLGAITLKNFLVSLPFLVVAIVFVLLYSRQIEMLQLSDLEAKSLGVRVKSTRIIILMFATLLISSVVAMTGLISFIGLISPHVARKIFKKNGTKTLVLSGLVASFILLAADIIVRLISVSEIPISVVTAIILLPMLFLFLFERSKKHE